MSHLQRNQTEPIDQLFQGILSLKSVEECYTFFSDLFTVQELTAFAQRFQVAGLLLDGNTYEMVRNQVPVSSSTITRINTELRYGSGGRSFRTRSPLRLPLLSRRNNKRTV